MVTLVANDPESRDHAVWTGGAFHAGAGVTGDIDGELAMAAEHVAQARGIVARQRAGILKLKVLGRATPDDELTLQALIGTLAQMESHAQVLAETARRLERPERLLS